MGLNSTTTWRQLLKSIITYGDNVGHDARTFTARSAQSRELLGYVTHWDMNHPLIADANRKLGYRFALAEPLWIASGSNRLDKILPFAKHLATFSDDGQFLAGAYGPPWVDQIPYVIEAFKRDPFTRQAVVSIWRPRPAASRDIPCTLSLQYLLRPTVAAYGREQSRLTLHCVAAMRSSDAWLGVPYDVATFSVLAAFLAIRLRAVGVDVRGIGELTLLAGSQHLYQQDYAAAEISMKYSPEHSAFDLFQPRGPRFAPEAFETVEQFADYLTALRDVDRLEPVIEGTAIADVPAFERWLSEAYLTGR